MSSKSPSLTYTGFGTHVKLGGVSLICTDMSISFSQKLINSNGSFFGGRVFDDSNMIHTTTPFRMDIPQVSISLNFQAASEHITKLKTMIRNRRTPVSVNILGISSNGLTFSSCYWDKIGVSAQQNSLVTGSVDLKTVMNYSDIYGLAMFIKHNNSNQHDEGYGVYNKSSSIPLPYFATSINDGKLLAVLNWNIDISQNVEFKTFCNNKGHSSSLPTMPTAITFGLLNCSLNFTSIIDNSSTVSLTKNSLPKYCNVNSGSLLSGVSLSVSYLNGNSTTTFLGLRHLQLQSFSPKLTNHSGYLTGDFQYFVGSIIASTT